MSEYEQEQGFADFTEPTEAGEQPAEETTVEEPIPTEPPKKKKKTGWIVFGVLCGVVVGALLGAGIVSTLQKNAVSEEQPTPTYEYVEQVIPRELHTNVGEKTLTPAEVYRMNVNTVAGISTESTVTNIFGQTSSALCSGSGFVLTEDGYVVTNYHVIENAHNIKVTMYDGKTYDAQLIGGYSDNDVALLKVEAEDLQCVSVGKSAELEVGEQVIAIGNPLGELTYTMTAGYISAKDRAINIDGTPINMLQTDVAINSGNSGGPLFDMAGNVVGITSAKYSGQSSSGAYIEGVSFAIPMDDVLQIIYDLQAYGYVKGQPYIGVSLRDLDKQTAEVYGLPLGVYVLSVDKGSGAEKGGMAAGDIITAMNGTKITSYVDLSVALRKCRAGETVDFEVYRAGQTTHVSVVLGEKQENTQDDYEGRDQQPAQEQTPSQTVPGFGFGFPGFEWFFGH